MAVNPKTPHGAWEFHEHLIPNSPAKPLRIWMEVGDSDLLNPNIMRDDMHDWVLANERMAKVLADKGYHYQFVFARNAGTWTAPSGSRRFPKLWNIFGRDIPSPPARSNRAPFSQIRKPGRMRPGLHMPGEVSKKTKKDLHVI